MTVPSPHQEVSATHLEVRPGTGPDRGVAVVTDLGSTNGTVLLQPGEDALDLRAGLGERLLPGSGARPRRRGHDPGLGRLTAGHEFPRNITVR